MKLEEAIKDSRYARENLDLITTDEGNIVLPAWQFALMLDKFERYRYNGILWALLVLVFAFIWIVMMVF